MEAAKLSKREQGWNVNHWKAVQTWKLSGHKVVVDLASNEKDWHKAASGTVPNWATLHGMIVTILVIAGAD